MAKTSTGTRKPSKAEQAKLAAANQANLEKPADEPHVITEEQRVADRRADDIAKQDSVAQFVKQQIGEAPNLETPPDAMAEFQRELAALQAKHGVTAKVAVKAAKPSKVQSNGITRPAAGTTCAKIWDTADEISAKTHGICAIASLKEHPEMKGVNDHTIKTQYARWRAFHGVTGRLPRLHAVQQTPGEYPGATPHEVAPVQDK